jgi:hypothetical protein
MRTLQGLAAQARRECDTNGLPAGNYQYRDICEDQQAYRAIEAMPSAEQIAERQAKREAEKAARMLAAKTLTPAELQLAIDTIEAARKHSLWNTSNGLHWDLIDILSKLRRMQNDNT